MKGLAIIGMIISLLFLMYVVVLNIDAYAYTYSLSGLTIIGIAESLSGGLIVFFLSAILWSLCTLKDSIDSLNPYNDNKRSEQD